MQALGSWAWPWLRDESCSGLQRQRWIASDHFDNMTAQRALTSQRKAFGFHGGAALTRPRLRAQRRPPAVCCSEWKTTGHVSRRTVLGKGGLALCNARMQQVSERRAGRSEKETPVTQGVAAAAQCYAVHSPPSTSATLRQTCTHSAQTMINSLAPSRPTYSVNCLLPAIYEMSWRCRLLLTTICQCHLWETGRKVLRLAGQLGTGTGANFAYLVSACLSYS